MAERIDLQGTRRDMKQGKREAAHVWGGMTDSFFSPLLNSRLTDVQHAYSSPIYIHSCQRVSEF